MPHIARKNLNGSVAETWEVLDKAMVFGRGDAVDARLHDDRVSRVHFTVAPRDGAYQIQDLKSTNGTYVNGVRITEGPLKPNDRIRVGGTVLVFETEQSKGHATVIGELSKKDNANTVLLGETPRQA